MKFTVLTTFIFFFTTLAPLAGMHLNVSYLDHIVYPGKDAVVYIDITVERDNDGNYNFNSEVYLNPDCSKPEQPIVFSRFSSGELILADENGGQIADIQLNGVKYKNKRVFDFSIERRYLKHSLFSFASVQELEDPNAHPIGSGMIYDVTLGELLNPWNINQGEGDFLDFCRNMANEKARKIFGTALFKGRNKGVLTFSNKGCTYRESNSKYFTVIKFSHNGILSVEVSSKRKKELKEDISGLKESLNTMLEVLSNIKKENGNDVKELSEEIEGLKKKIDELKKEYDSLK